MKKKTAKRASKRTSGPSKASGKTSKDSVKKTMAIGEVVSKYPESAEIMMKYGLHCIGCHVAAWETIEQGCRGHGMSEKDIKKMVEEINNSIKKR